MAYGLELYYDGMEVTSAANIEAEHRRAKDAPLPEFEDVTKASHAHQQPRICGVRRRIFWISVALAILAAAAWTSVLAGTLTRKHPSSTLSTSASTTGLSSTTSSTLPAETISHDGVTITRICSASGNTTTRDQGSKWRNTRLVRPEEVQEWIRPRVAKHKALAGDVVFVGEIPKLMSGKIQRNVLREWARRDLEALEARARLYSNWWKPCRLTKWDSINIETGQ